LQGAKITAGQAKLQFKRPFLKMPPTEMDTMRLGYVYLAIINMFEQRGVLE